MGPPELEILEHGAAFEDSGIPSLNSVPFQEQLL